MDTIRKLNSEQYTDFLAERPVAVVHFDAEWDKVLRERTRRSMVVAQEAFGDQVSFGEIDADSNVALCRSIPVWNVPLVAYYRDGKLFAALIGAGQNVRLRVERVLRGDPIGYDDGTTATQSSMRRFSILRWLCG